MGNLGYCEASYLKMAIIEVCFKVILLITSKFCYGMYPNYFLLAKVPLIVSVSVCYFLFLSYSSHSKFFYLVAGYTPSIDWGSRESPPYL